MNGHRSTQQRGAALIMMIAVIAVIGALAAGLVMLTANMLHATTKDINQTKTFNLAEAGLAAGQAALHVNWPTAATPSPAPTVDSSVVATQFPTPLPSPTSTSTPFLYVSFYSNGTAANPGINYGSSVDEGSGSIWIVSKAATANRAAEVMALVKKVPYTLQIATGVAIATAGSLSVSGTGNQSVVGLDPPATAATVYDGSYSANGNASMDSGLTRVDGTTPDYINTTIFPTQVLENLVQTANASGKEFASWLALKSSINNSQTALTNLFSSGPRIIVIDSGDVDTKDFPTTDGGSTIWTENNPGILIVLNGNVNDTGGKTTIYGIVHVANGMLMRGNTEIHGMLVALGSATLKGTRAVVYNQNVINNLNKPTTLSVTMVPNTWRQVPYLQQ